MIGKDLKKGLEVITGKTGQIVEKAIEETERVKLKMQADKIEERIRSSYRELGVISYERIINGMKDLHKDDEIKKIMDEIRENSLEKKRLLAEEEI